MANSTATYEPHVPISTIRSEYPNAKVLIAVGGWGDTVGFSEASRTSQGITQFANDVQTMLQNTGADGVDIDWEYPGGNGADYKRIPNSSKTYEIAAYPKLLAAVRKTIGNDKILSIAVPGKPIDMIAYTAETGPDIWSSVDHINIMSYDIMNRRDTHTSHHTSVEGAKAAVENYIAIGAPTEKINLGFALYAKYFQTAEDCTGKEIGCKIVLAEDPITGDDTLTSGAWTFERHHLAPIDVSNISVSWDGRCGAETMTKCASGCCSPYGHCGTAKEFCSGGCQHAFGTGCTDPDTFGSWQTAAARAKYDEEAGGQYYYDADEGLFWTWDTPEIMSRKFDEIVRTYGLGGAMAWSLGEDSYDWSHIRQIASEVKKMGYGAPDPSNQELPSIEAPENMSPEDEYPSVNPYPTQELPAQVTELPSTDPYEITDEDSWEYWNPLTGQWQDEDPTSSGLDGSDYETQAIAE